MPILRGFAAACARSWRGAKTDNVDAAPRAVNCLRSISATPVANGGVDQASLRRLAALSFKISGRTSSLISIFSKSESHRSGEIIGQSEPNRTFFRSSVLQYWTRIFGKYFGDQPERSM